jgi:uncharacterized sulfatase
MSRTALTRRDFIRTSAGFIAGSSFLTATAQNEEKNQSSTPNVLIIMADDCTHSDLPVYGGQNAVTPTIDKLAREGLLFNHAYVSSAMCQPCRAALFSGQFPVRNGCSYNHSASRPETQSMPHYLQPAGCRVGIAGKVHVLPHKAFPFESVPGFDNNCVRNPTRPHDLNGIREFMTRSAQPFCLVVALVEPHVPWVMGDRTAYRPETVKLPPNLADTPQTREDFCKYLAEISYMDSQVSDILQTLAASGKADNTLVLFTSEQGAQFPGCKWTNWDAGLHTALIARWPGRVPAGKRTDAVVQYVDILPTLLELTGADPKEHAAKLDGASFASVLAGRSQTHRKFAYGVHNNIPEGPAYPIRSITDGRFRYIRNLKPDAVYIERHLMGYDGKTQLTNQYWPTWVADAADDPHTYDLVKRYMSRPPEQLYYKQADPFELNNLAADPQYSDTKTALSAELDRWMARQNDPGAVLDTDKVYQAAKNRNHIY